MTLRQITVCLVLSLLSALAARGSDWRIHANFVGSQVRNVVDTGDRIYYLASDNLYCFDKQTQENEAWNRRNHLSDVTVTQIYYNPDKKYLVLVYDNSNIDLVADDGSVVNLPQLLQAQLSMSKTVNDVTFASGNRILVATGFGYVVFDDTSHEVLETHLYDRPLASAAVVGQLLLLCDDTQLYYGDDGHHYDVLGEFKTFAGLSGCRLLPVNATRFLAWGNGLHTCGITAAADGLTFDAVQVTAKAPDQVGHMHEGYIANFVKDGVYYTFDTEGLNATRVEGGNEMFASAVSGSGTLWAVGDKGLHEAGNTEAVYLPQAMSIANHPFYLTYNAARDQLYVSNTTANAFFSDDYPATEINTWDGNHWQVVTPEALQASGIRGGRCPLFVPGHPDSYFYSTWSGGLFRVDGNEPAVRFVPDNSPRGRYLSIEAFDAEGNLWSVQSNRNEDHPVMVLPKGRVMLTEADVSDWATPAVNGTSTGEMKRSCFVIAGDVKVFADGAYNHGITFWDGGANNANRRVRNYFNFLDQDDKSYSWLYIVCLTVDANGRVWMGTDDGVVSFDPSAALADNFSINHIKVNRNDGTDLADYLLAGIQVNHIAVDDANRKWIATNTAGLVVVSADGSQIIHQFNTSNSYIPSNRVFNVCCVPGSKSVFVMTDKGLAEYVDDSGGGGGSGDFSDVYAYPNPVRPDYGGDITVTGLLDNSLVKIVDPAGNVVAQFKSTGGTLRWDGCNLDGDAVKTGIYTVLATSSDSGSSARAVTKIAIIR